MNFEELMTPGALWQDVIENEQFICHFVAREVRDLSVTYGDKELSFAEMGKLRGPVDPEEMARQMQDKHGFFGAGLGVSTFATFEFGDDDKMYLALIPKQTGEGSEAVTLAKLPSEYWDVSRFPTPVKAGMQGFLEEIIFATDGKILAGTFGTGKNFGRVKPPYETVQEHIAAEENFHGSIGRGHMPSLRGLDLRRVPQYCQVGGRIYHDSLHSSGQLVLPIHIRVPNPDGITIHYVDDVPFWDDEKVKHLHTKFTGDKVLFVPLGNDGELVREAYVHEEGNLKEFEFPEELSEVFTPTENDIVVAPSISSADYFAN